MTMSKMNSLLFFKCSLVFLTTLVAIEISNAQVQFKLTLLEDEETYLVSLIPEKTWVHPNNITSTAQVTIKASTRTFEVKDLKSLQPNVEWADNSRSDAPPEAPEYDYISFGLSTLGTANYVYKKGVELPLFTFKNTLSCQGTLSLMDNKKDAFAAPNSRRANVGNSITIFGARGEAYSGNMEQFSTIPCQNELSTSLEEGVEDSDQNPNIYPNPAFNEVAVDLNWNAGRIQGELIITNTTGREVRRETIWLNRGFNNFPLKIEKLPFGVYSIEMNTDGTSSLLGRFVKANSF